MTAPGDGDGLEEALRRGLAEAVGRIEPSADGLERIRARIGHRRPRPWLLTVGADALGAARHWVWRGHWSWQWSWAWPTALPAAVGGAAARVPWLVLPRLRRLPRPGELLRLGSTGSPRTAPVVGVGWLRPVGVLVAVALIASVSFGVQPFRQAIVQASNTVLSGGGPSGGGRAGTDGDGTQTSNGTGSSGAGPTPTGAHGPTRGAGATSSGGTASASPTTSSTCVATVTTDATSAMAASSAPTVATSAGSATFAAASERQAELLVRSLTPSARSSPTPTPTCGTSTPSVTPTPATSSGAPTISPSPSVGAMSPTPTTSPTPTPTLTPTDSGSDTPTSSPSDSNGTGDAGGAGDAGGDTVTSTSTPSS
jgi:hypothetical protein